MELLLNLAWLLLALPAYWLWRDCRSIHFGRRSSLQCLLSLACLLVLLFPVISATDDMRVMRAEMEESPTGKRSVSHKSGDKTTACKWQHPPLLAVISTFVLNHDEGCELPPTPYLSVLSTPTVTPIGRAPPTFSLS